MECRSALGRSELLSHTNMQKIYMDITKKRSQHKMATIHVILTIGYSGEKKNVSMSRVSVVGGEWAEHQGY